MLGLDSVLLVPEPESILRRSPERIIQYSDHKINTHPYALPTPHRYTNTNTLTIGYQHADPIFNSFHNNHPHPFVHPYSLQNSYTDVHTNPAY